MMNTLFIFCIAALFTGLEVDEMTFDGKAVHLNGHFKWAHPMGLLESKSADLQFEGGNQMPSEVTLKEGVLIHLNDTGKLSCPFAVFDCKALKGVLHGRLDERVVFEKGAEKLKVESLNMEIFLLPFGKEGSLKMDHIIANDSVEIKTAGYILTSDQGVFDSFTPNGAVGRAMLTALGGERGCMIKNEAADEIHAKAIDVDLIKEEAVLDAPLGKMQKEGATLSFDANKMHLNQKEEIMTLFPPLKIDWLGSLESSGPLALNKANESIQSEGPSILKMKGQKIETFGSLVIDSATKQVVMTSPNEEQQIHFSDPFGDIFADKMVLNYESVEGHIKPILMHLEGHLRLQNTSPLGQRYALADSADFVFAKDELTLKSKSRVLFYDPVNKVQASAPSLILKRDKATGKDLIQGTHSVRFCFAEEEFNELKKRFSFEHDK
jgi:hypothetical protein